MLMFVAGSLHHGCLNRCLRLQSAGLYLGKYSRYAATLFGEDVEPGRIAMEIFQASDQSLEGCSYKSNNYLAGRRDQRRRTSHSAFSQ